MDLNMQHKVLKNTGNCHVHGHILSVSVPIWHGIQFLSLQLTLKNNIRATLWVLSFFQKTLVSVLRKFMYLSFEEMWHHFQTVFFTLSFDLHLSSPEQYFSVTIRQNQRVINEDCKGDSKYHPTQIVCMPKYWHIMPQTFDNYINQISDTETVNLYKFSIPLLCNL